MMRTAVSPLSLLRPRTLREAPDNAARRGAAQSIGGVHRRLRQSPVRNAGREALRRSLAAAGASRHCRRSRHAAHRRVDDLYGSIQSPLVRRRVPMLVAASREIGGRQIQNRGTLGGNIANASPAGDALPVLAVADATIVLSSAEGVRRVPFNDLLHGLSHERAASGRDHRGDRRSLGSRAASTGERSALDGRRRFQKSCAPPCAALRCAWRWEASRPTVLRLRRTERVLTAGSSLKQAQAVMRGEIAPIDDLRSTADYRREVSVNLLADFWHVTRNLAESSARSSGSRALSRWRSPSRVLVARVRRQPSPRTGWQR